MRKGLFTAAILAGGLVFSLVGCGGNNQPVDKHTYTISIDNKAELQAEWLSDDASRNINLTITKDGKEENATAAVNKGEVTFTVSDESVVRVQGRQATPVGPGSATITAKYGKASDDVAVTITYSDPHGKSEDDPLTVAEAVALTQTLDSGAMTVVDYYTSGVVSSCDGYDSGYGNITFDIVDSLTDTSKFVRCYRVKPIKDATYDVTKIDRGSEVLIKGKLQNYNGNLPEYPAGSEILSATEGLKPQIIPTNVAGALAAAQALADNTSSFDKYEITGYITAVKSGSGFYMSDTKGAVEPSQDQFLVYYKGEMPADATVNAKVKVLAKLKHYVSTSTAGAYAYETAGNAPEQYTLLEAGDPAEIPEVYMNVETPVVGTKYRLGVKTSGRGDKGDLYLTGKKSGNFIETDHEFDKAPQFELVEVTDSRGDPKYNVKVTYNDNSTKFLNVTVSGDYNNYSFDDEAKTAYIFNSAAKTLYVELGGHTTASKDGTYYLGTYGTNVNVSASLASYIEGDNASKVDVSQFPIHFCTKGEKPQPVELTGVEVSPKTSNVDLQGTTQAKSVTLTAKPLPENAELGDVTWESSDELVTVAAGVVSIPADYVAEGGEAKSVTITAKAGKFSDAATITVKNTGVPAQATTDNITPEFTGLPVPASGEGATYADWSGKTGTSGAVYAGNSAISGDKYGDPVGLLQLRYDTSKADKRAGVWTTATGGKLVSVTIKCNAKTTDNREFLVFASNTAYSAIADVADASAAVATLKKTSTELVLTYTFEADYTFICVRTKSGAAYLDSIDISWK